MIAVSVKLSDTLSGALDTWEADVKEKTLISGAAEMGRVIYKEVRLNASGTRQGQGLEGGAPAVLTGKLFNAIYRRYVQEKSSGERAVYRVSVNKKMAPHWWLVEYGWSRAPAHPYLRPAHDYLPQAVSAGLVRMEQRMKEIPNR